MEIIIKRKDFIKVLDKVSEVISPKPAINILNGILIETKEEEIFLTATDLENTIRTSIEGKILNKGAILIQGKKLTSLIKQLDDEEIKITTQESQINIHSKNSIYTFIGMNYEEFPKLPKFSGGVTIKLDSLFLKNTIEKSKFCIYPDEPRPYFRGALLEIKNKFFNFVATDTKRLSLIKTQLQQEIQEPVKCLLPYKLLNLLPNILEEGEIEISIGKNQIFFKINNIFLTAQLLEGSQDFPDYEKAIPDEKKIKTAYINKNIFLSTLKRISLFTSERYNKVKFTFSKQKLNLYTNSPEIGEAQEKIIVEYDGDEQAIAFNPEYLLDFLQKAEGEKIIFGFTNDKKPALLKTDKDPGYIYVAMPLKLD